MIKILVVLDKFNSYIREFGIVKKHLFLSTVHFLECESANMRHLGHWGFNLQLSLCQRKQQQSFNLTLSLHENVLDSEVYDTWMTFKMLLGCNATTKTTRSKLLGTVDEHQTQRFEDHPWKQMIYAKLHEIIVFFILGC